MTQSSVFISRSLITIQHRRKREEIKKIHIRPALHHIESACHSERNQTKKKYYKKELDILRFHFLKHLHIFWLNVEIKDTKFVLEFVTAMQFCVVEIMKV